MYRVRIKTAPNGGTHQETGQQDGYGLVRNNRVMQNAPQSVSVNNKMGGIPRDQANIEVEGGESVIGDVNNDGTMELMHFQGKRHSEGGIPVNIPEGSFIFSDTKSLTIKDKEVIEKIFNLPFRKQGYTPGEISKKYEINTYIEILKDDNADPLSKRSAGEMLKKNKQKLGILAFIQESMKGFPDGIPAIAEEVLATMGIDPNQMAQQFAPQQPEQGMGMQEGMMPPQQGQGIPMSEDEDAMAGMMPEGPAVAPDDVASQMMGRYGGSMLPRFEEGGWFEMMQNAFQYPNSAPKTGCKSGFVWNPYVKECVTSQYASTKDIFRIPEHGFQSNAQEWSSAPAAQPKKKPTATQVKAQNNFDKNFKVTNTPTNYEKSKVVQLKSLEEQRQKSGYYTKAKELEPLMAKVMSGNATAEEEARVKEINEALMGITSDGTYTKDRQAEETAIYNIDKQYGTLSQEQIAKKKREDDAVRVKAEADAKLKNPYKDNIPGFGTKSDLDAYMSENAEQYTAGEAYYNALLSGDPAMMIAAADDIKQIDVPWNVGWLPFSDQDKIDDMHTILYEEALKKLNTKQKEIITKSYDVKTVETKLNDVIAHFEKARDAATDISTKLQLSKVLERYNKRKKQLFDDKQYLGWYNDVQKSNVTPNSSGWLGFLDYDLGNPIQDKKFGFGDDETLISFVEDVTQQHDRIKSTNVSATNPLAFKGQTSSGGSGNTEGLIGMSESDSFERFDTEGKVKEVYTSLYKNDNKPSSATTFKAEYKVNALPNSTFRVDTDANGKAVWTEYTEDGAEMAVSDANLVKELNAKATAAESKPGKPVVYAIKPAEDVGTGSIIDILNEEMKLNPGSTTNQSGSGTSNQTQKKSVIAPVKSPAKEKPKFENGLTDDDFKFKTGGVVGQTMRINNQQFRYGGLIDEEGKLRYNRGGSVLPKYAGAGTVTGPGDPPKEEYLDDYTIPSTGQKTKRYKQIFTDPNGGPPTTIVIIRDATDETKIVGRRNNETGESYKSHEPPVTRASSTWITPDILTKEEQDYVDLKWNGNKQAYVDFQNSNNQIRLNKELRKDIAAQYKLDVNDAGKGMYSGDATKRAGYHASYGKDVEKIQDDEEAIINNMMQFEQNNARLAAFNLGRSADQNIAGTSGQGAYVNKTAADLIKANPNGLGDLDFSKNYMGQGTYISYRRTLQNNPKYADFASWDASGQNDESIFGIKGKVSGIDNYNTDTTLFERLGYKAKPPQPQVKPGEKQAFYCVENSDGTKSVQTVSYKEGETPTAPTGDKVVKATQYDTLELANTNCEVPKEKPKDELIPPKKRQPDTWFTPDVINLATGERQRVPHPNAVLRQMPQIYSGYDLNNPITQIAGITGLSKQKADLAMNTLDPTVANAMGAGEGYDALAKGIAGVEEKNVDTVNNYLGRIGQLQYNYDAANMQGRRQFDVDSEVGKEEFAAQLNKKDAQNAMLYNTGWGNVFKDNGFRLAYPQAQWANRITPDYSWSGNGKNPLGPDTSVSPGGNLSGQSDCSGVYAEAYNSVKNDASRDEAAKKEYASRMEASCLQQNNSRANKTQQQQYVANTNSLFGAEFGGVFYTAPGSFEFGGSYFDDY